MDKVYIPVKELLTAYGVPFSELMERVQSGSLSVYYMKAYDYIRVENFDSFIDDWIARQRKRLENQYTSEICNIRFTSERTIRAREIARGISARWQETGNIRRLGEDEIIKSRYDSEIKKLENKERIARELAIQLFIKSSEYENTANKAQTGNGGRTKDTGRIEKTEKAFREVENLNKETLANMDKLS